MQQKLKTLLNDIISKLDYGYKESVYQKALCYKLQDNGHKVEREVVRDIVYEKYILGSVRVDIVIDNEYIIEMKSISKIGEKEKNQLKRYLDLFNKDIGYLINVNHKEYEIIEVRGKKQFNPVSY